MADAQDDTPQNDTLEDEAPQEGPVYADQNRPGCFDDGCLPGCMMLGGVALCLTGFGLIIGIPLFLFGFLSPFLSNLGQRGKDGDEP